MKFVDPEAIIRYFPNTSLHQQKQFRKLGSVYEKINSNINLISRTDLENLYIRHILHSLSILKFISFEAGSHVMDLGTGGGFPGIPLAIFCRNVNFTLVDSISKKVTAVESIIDELKLENVRVICSRAEDMDERFDFIVSRATAPMEKLRKWSRRLIKNNNANFSSNGIIALKGGDLNDELARVKDLVTVVDISTFFEEDFFYSKKIVYLKC